MVYKKRSVSRSLEQARLRYAGVKTIDPQLDFGDDRSLSVMAELMAQLEDKLTDYNSALTHVDTLRAEIKEMEQTLGTLSSEMLLAVAFRYGKDSVEYQMAGGVRRQERIRRSSYARIEADPPKVEAK